MLSTACRLIAYSANVIMAKSIRAIAQSPEFDTMQEYYLRRKDISDEDAELVCEGGPMAVFQARKLTVLEVNGFEKMTTMNPGIGQLEHLLRLSYTYNSLDSLPAEIGRFQSLKYFDLSCNRLSSLPRELYLLSSLQTLVLARNELKDESFPDLQSAPNPILPMLRHVNLSHNKLTKIPEFVSRADQVTELFASNNEIGAISSDLLLKGHLRVLDLSRNQLSSLPYEITGLKKLKTFEVKENPIKDKRLLKLIVQHGDTKPKTVLDYIATKGPQPDHQGGKVKDVKACSKLPSSKKASTLEGKPSHLVEVTRRDVPFVVSVSKSARQHRPHLVCTVIRHLDLSESKVMKKFLALQMTLHDTLCSKRKLATIATHNMAALTPPVLYDAQLLENVSLVPLGYSQPTTAKDFVALLHANKPPARAGKKASKKPADANLQKKSDPVAASLSKYLDLVEGKDEIALLVDGSGCVISIPPLTNSEATKLNASVHDVFVEVSSTRSLPACKNVMNTLLLEMIKQGIGSSEAHISSLDKDSKDKSDDDDDDDDDLVSFENSSKAGPRVHLMLEPVRVVDSDGSLLSVFPSRTDLQFDKPDILVRGL